MNDRVLCGLLLSGVIACGPGLDPEPQGEVDASTEGDGSTGADDVTASGAATEPTTASTGADGGSGEDSSDSSSGGEFPSVTGRWECGGFEDPIFVEILSWEDGDPPSIEGRGCGVTAEPEVHPFEGDNCDELMSVLDLGINFLFGLPYQDFPEVGTLGVEFIGGHDTTRDVLVGTLWTSATGVNNGVECTRVEP